MRHLIKSLIAIIVIVVIVLIAKSIILGHMRVISLQSSTISGAIASSIQSSSSYYPIENKDYAVGHIQYFDNKQWAVVSILPVGTSSDSATLVLKMSSGGYKTAFGPANSFQGANLSALPAEVAKYVKTGR